MSQRYSTLAQITPQNVKNLELQWMFQARSLEKFEATPLVVDGILYTVQAPNNVVALDAVTGRVFWTYPYAPSRAARPCCGAVNRGLAILGDTLFMGTIDAHLIALDAKSGKPIWNVAVAKAEAGLCADARAAGDQRQSDRRDGGRRIRDSRLHRRVRRENRQGSLALLHHPRQGRAGQRNLEGRFVEARRRIGLGDRLLRSGTEPDVLGHRKSGAGLEWRHARRRQSL